MKIGVVGGSGFVGSRLVRALSDHDVTVFDQRTPKYPCEYKYCPLPHSSLNLSGFEVVYHLAANSDIASCELTPYGCFSSNTEGTFAVLDAAKDAGVRRVVFASSAAVYGNRNNPAIDLSLPTNPTSHYGASKIASELYCRLFRSNGLETVALRYFNIYGGGKSVVDKFIADALQRLPCNITGDGNQTRDYIHVDDVVRATVLAGTVPLGTSQAINIGTGVGSTVNQIVSTIGRVSGRDIEHNFTAPDGGAAYSVADMSTAISVLGFASRISLEDGIRRMINEC